MSAAPSEADSDEVMSETSEINHTETGGEDSSEISEYVPPPRKIPKTKYTVSAGIGTEPIRIVFAPNSSVEPKIYYIHPDALKATSEYFITLLRFPGREQQLQEVRLDEGYEGLEDAFDAFVEYIYKGDYEDSLLQPDNPFYKALFAADVIVLAERLVAKGLQDKAIEKLEEGLNHVSPVYAVRIIRTIYDGTHRPYDQPNGHPESAAGFATFPMRVTCPHKPYVYMTESVVACKEEECINDFKEKRMAMAANACAVRNCKARKVLCRGIARQLSLYRRFPGFRECLEEIGEFASDLIMEQISVPSANEWSLLEGEVIPERPVLL
ncbi:hypothetical protein BJ508DRAFT_155722 [Ascobolus immersus RN42]|uniref:BTB domain-containing protein n=1 Tax=Ascobolus immersus RN42 TaxID=1160509 RepID=A0A3N4I2W0_ASCIM|nr:hypothetical protein BJ508DRAFT_155722 [Ascobolus immersus RN42]